MFSGHEPATRLPEERCLLYCTAYINIVMYGVGQVVEALRHKP
jgi:hypothetical protein